MNAIIKKSLWILPFLSFIISYLLLSVYFKEDSFKMPSFIGKSIHEAVLITSSLNIMPYIIEETDDVSYKPGTIIRQIPHSNTSIKKNQIIYFVVNKKQSSIKAPLLQGKKQDEVSYILNKKKIAYTLHFVPSHYPHGICIAQHPSADKEIQNNKMIIYYSKGNQKAMLFPNLIGKHRNNALKILTSISQKIGIKRDKNYENYPHKNIISQQQPLPGSLVNIHKPLNIQLYIT